MRTPSITLWCERRQSRGQCVVRHLAGSFASGDGTSNSIEHKDPTQCELAHAHAFRHQSTQFFDGCQRDFVIDSGKGFANIEALPLAIEVAVIVVGKLGVRLELAREQAAGQRNARQDAHLPEFCLGKEELSRTLAKAVEDDLDALHVGEFDGLQCLFHALDADPVEADLACAHQVVEYAEDFGPVVGIRGRAVELNEIEGLSLQVAQIVFNPGGEIGAAVAFDCLLGQTPAHFGGHDDLFFASLLQPSNQVVAAAASVDIRGIEKIDARVDGLVERSKRLLISSPDPRRHQWPTHQN